jgi:hypothetical protein
MFVHLVCLNVLAMGLLAGQSGLPPSDGGTGFSITGTMVDPATGGHLAHTRVTVSPANDRDKLTTVVTGEDGRFVFSGLAAGKYSMRAQRNGYLSQSFDQHGLYDSSIAVGPELDSGNLIFTLSRECSISGAITDEANEGVPDAQVTLFLTGTTNGSRRTDLIQTVTTTEEGSYAFAHLSAGRYFVVVSARPWYAQRMASNSQHDAAASSQLDVGYPVTFYPGVSEAGNAQPIVIKPGDQFVANVGLQPVPAIRLHFNSEGGGSRITSAKLESPSFDGVGIPVFAEIASSSSGAADVLGVPAGHYTVQISTTGARHPGTLSAREIAVSNTGQMETIPEEPSVIATITVRRDSGAVLPREASLLFHNSKTGKDFVKTLNGGSDHDYKQILPPGRYEVSLDYASGMYIKTMSAVGATVSHQTLEIKGISPIQVVLEVGQASGKITGVALRAVKPFPGAMVVLVPSDPAHNSALFRSDQSNSDGSFALSYVAPGEYTLLAIEKGWDLEWRNPAVLKPYLAQGQVLRVQQNGTFQIKVAVQ